MLITKNSTPLYIPVVKSKYSSIEITFLDQSFAPLTIRDKEIVVILSIRKVKE